MSLYTTPESGQPTIWRYYLPNVRGTWEGWAVIVIDSLGFVFANSDYGGYAYRWSAFGPCIRSFLARTGPDYFLSKIARRDDVYYGERTAEKVRRHILSRRRDRSFSREKARREWDLVRHHSSLDSQLDFGFWWAETEIENAHEYQVFDYCSDAKAFVEKVLPRLQAVLREELAAEALSAAVAT